MFPTEREARIAQLSEQLAEIEHRLIPTGLHVFGRAAELTEKSDLLRMVAAFDRPEMGVRSLPGLVATSLGLELVEAEFAQPAKQSRLIGFRREPAWHRGNLFPPSPC